MIISLQCCCICVTVSENYRGMVIDVLGLDIGGIMFQIELNVN